MLKGINKPIAVLSIAGPSRTGKSYILSRLLGIPGAFELGHYDECSNVWDLDGYESS